MQISGYFCKFVVDILLWKLQQNKINILLDVNIIY